MAVSNGGVIKCGNLRGHLLLVHHELLGAHHQNEVAADQHWRRKRACTE